jgi:hypothetical protein
MRLVLFAGEKRKPQQDVSWEGGKRKEKESPVVVRSSIALPDVIAVGVSGVENVW